MFVWRFYTYDLLILSFSHWQEDRCLGRLFLFREPRVKHWLSQFDTVFLINLLQNVSVLRENILIVAMLQKFEQGSSKGSVLLK